MKFEFEGDLHSISKIIMAQRLSKTLDSMSRPWDNIHFQKGSVRRKLFSLRNMFLFSILAKIILKTETQVTSLVLVCLRTNQILSLVLGLAEALHTLEARVRAITDSRLLGDLIVARCQRDFGFGLDFCQKLGILGLNRMGNQWLPLLPTQFTCIPLLDDLY